MDQDQDQDPDQVDGVPVTAIVPGFRSVVTESAPRLPPLLVEINCLLL